MRSRRGFSVEQRGALLRARTSADSTKLSHRTPVEQLFPQSCLATGKLSHRTSVGQLLRCSVARSTSRGGAQPSAVRKLSLPPRCPWDDDRATTNCASRCASIDRRPGTEESIAQSRSDLEVSRKPRQSRLSTRPKTFGHLNCGGCLDMRTQRWYFLAVPRLSLAGRCRAANKEPSCTRSSAPSAYEIAPGASGDLIPDQEYQETQAPSLPPGE